MDEMLNAVEHTNFFENRQRNTQRLPLRVHGKKHLLS